LSHSAWTRLFGGARDVLGRGVRVNGREMTVIGVAPQGFHGTDLVASADFWLPIGMYPEVGPYPEWFDVRGATLFRALGKLAEEVDATTAEEDLMRVARELEAEYPKEAEGLGGRLRPLRESIFTVGDQDRYRGYGETLRIAAALILLICCIDVAHLLLVRGARRQKELAVRRAMGASRGRIAGQLLSETLVLFLLGGLLALPAARLALDLLWRFRPPQLPADIVDLGLDFRIFALCLGATLVLGLLFGALPALSASRVEMVPHLKDGTPGEGGRRRFTPQRLLVVAQVALALVSLLGAGLLLRSLQAAYAVDLGFDLNRLAVLRIAPGDQGYDREKTLGLYRDALDAMEGLPGVESVALSENRLLRGAVWQRQIFLPGGDEGIVIGERALHRTNAVMPGFFDTVGIPLLEGRDFNSGDGADSQPVVIVNRTLAERAWPEEGAIGQLFRFDYVDGPQLQVVGVVEDARYRHVRESEQFFLYLPIEQEFRGAATLHLRTAGDPAAVLGPARAALAELAPELPLEEVAPLTSFVDEDLWLDRTSVRFLGFFALLALVLAMVGVYGVVAQSVARRRREIGIRLALGAKRGTILQRLLRETLSLSLAGLALGALAAALLFRFTSTLSAQLQDVTWTDPLTWLLTSALLLLAALLGGFLPSRRAAGADPARALRED
jgi:predicted permease